MSQITKVRFWKDVGFQDGAIEVPSIDDHLPEPDAEFEESIKTSTSEFFSAFTIPEVFADYLSMSYIGLEYEYNNFESEEPMTFYGWIDDIALKSDTDGNPSITVSWHIDHWRTYLANARFGYGLVQNRPRATDDPPQLCTARYRLPVKDNTEKVVFDSLAYKGDGAGLQWILLTYTAENSSHKITECRTMVAPVSKDAPAQSYYLRLAGTETAVQCPSLSEFINGDYDEKYGISASSVSSVFVSPVPPFEVDHVDGSTVYLKTSPTQTSTQTSTQTGDMPSYRVTSCRMAKVRVTNFYYRAYWTDAEHPDEQTETFRGSYKDDIKNWLNAHPGARDSTGVLHATVNGNSVDFIMWKTIDGYARECTSGLNPVTGATFTINAGYVGTNMAHDISVSDVSTGSVTESVTDGQYTGGITATWNGSSWVSDKGTYVCFTSVNDGKWTYTTSQSSTAYSVSLATSNITSGYGYAYTSTGHYPELQQTLGRRIKTTDTEEFIFTDMTGAPLGSVPWGIELYSYTARVIVSATSAYVEYRFNDIDSHSIGTSFVVPLPPVDLTSNSWSDYVYSGQRDYDIEQRRIATEQALTSGIVSALTGGIDTAVMGALTNTKTMTTEKRSYAYGRESASESIEGTTTTRGIGGAKAGAIGIGAGIIGAGANYLIAQYYNGQLQKAEDILSAKQIDSITMAGNGWDWMWNGRECGFICLKGDKYSVDRFENDIRLNGVSVSEPTEDCDTYRTQEGPVRIAELVVTGDIPVQARAYIKGRMANGVRIRTINTEQPTE